MFRLLLLGLILLLIFYFVVIYNRFQALKNGAEATLNQIKVALKKKLDLIGQLVESVENYANYERSLIEYVTQMRKEILSANSPKDIEKLDKDSSKVFERILAFAEAYPELKTSEVVKDLNRSIAEVEDEIARLRYTYNNIVQEFNTLLDQFPSNLVAKAFGFSKKEYLKIEGLEKKPKLDWFKS